jgi:hypothetical protein
MALRTPTRQIGKCGELLVQLRLLLAGVESAPMTTDTGIDLVAYSPRRTRPITIQVKTNLKPKPAGGTGRPALDWWVPEKCPADLIACVDLSQEHVWLFRRREFARLAQQHSGGRNHLYFYCEPGAGAPAAETALASKFHRYLAEARIHALF